MREPLAGSGRVNEGGEAVLKELRKSLLYLLTQRFWIGLASVLGGASLILIHYIDYGGTLHFTFPDHGTVGLLLVIIGALLAGLKPGVTRSKDKR